MGKADPLRGSYYGCMLPPPAWHSLCSCLSRGLSMCCRSAAGITIYVVWKEPQSGSTWITPDRGAQRRVGGRRDDKRNEPRSGSAIILWVVRKPTHSVAPIMVACRSPPASRFAPKLGAITCRATTWLLLWLHASLLVASWDRYLPRIDYVCMWKYGSIFQHDLVNG